ncbi:MAG: hypothetical protein WCC78_03105 [Terriglobales bacterium]
MAAELKVYWNGTAPGLAEHRLSIGAFGQPLNNLLIALRRIATQMVNTAIEGEYPKVGRLSKVASQLDIEIVSIAQNSSGVDALVMLHIDSNETPPLFNDLVDRATVELLESIERESKGQASNSAVRTYLKSLPSGVNRQTYAFSDNGHVRKSVDIGDLKFVELMGDLPMLEELAGSIIGVGFDPGKNEVRLKTETNPSASISADPDAVERALTRRHEKVRTLAVRQGTKMRLLSLKKASEPRFRLTSEAVEEHIFKRWYVVLERLAK